MLGYLTAGGTYKVIYIPYFVVVTMESCSVRYVHMKLISFACWPQSNLGICSPGYWHSIQLLDLYICAKDMHVCVRTCEIYVKIRGIRVGKHGIGSAFTLPNNSLHTNSTKQFFFTINRAIELCESDFQPKSY